MKRHPQLRKLLLPAFLAIFLYGVFAGGTILVGAPTLPVLFTDNTASTGITTTVTTMEAELLNRLNSAVTSIDLAIYDFNRDSIRDALIAAHDRGVVVRVVTDDEAREHIASYIPYYAALEDAGIAIVDDDRAADIMHNKFIIIDGGFVWSGSTNVTDNGFTKNHNNSVVISDTAVAKLYEAEFNQMFNDGKFSIHKDQLVTTTFEYNGIPLEFYFSPEGDALGEVIKEVDSAVNEISFAIFFFTSDPLRDALIAAKGRGVKIKGVWDNLGASNAFSDDEALCAARIPIKIETYKGKMHNKFLVIDPNGPNPRTVTGSMNWTVAGTEDNDENTVIIHDSTTAQLFKENFDELYNSLPAELACAEEVIELTSTFIYLPLITSSIDPNAEPTSIPTQTPAPTVTPVPTQTPTPEPMVKVELIRIVYNPDGSDVDGEFVELSNNGTTSADMTGWVMQDDAGIQYVFPAFTLNPASNVTLWVKTGTNHANNLYWNRGSAVWNNTGDAAYLLDSVGGEIVDTCAYIGGEVEANCGE